MRTHLSALLLAAALSLLAARGDALSATTITLPTDFSDELVASLAAPTALAFTPDGRMLITTQPGQLRVYQNGALVSTPALDLNDHARDICTTSERGLLGVEVDPNFGANGWIYLYWSPRLNSTTCKNRLSRFTMTGNTVSLGSELVLVDNIPAPLGTHNAGDVHVGKDGHLYVSVGDGGRDYAGDSGDGTLNDAARDLHALVGKILRITRDGGIPSDNPFTGAGTMRCNTTGTTTSPNRCQEIFSTGLRNPFRIAFDPNATGVKFHINDVGQNTWEEIDLGTAGADYGWNVREGPCVRGSTSNCGPPPAGMTNPIFSYQQGDPSGCRAITGGAFVPNGIWPSAYTGSYLFADYVCGRIFKLDVVGGNYVRTDFASGLGSNSAVHMRFGPHGATQALYYTTYEGSGSVRRIVYTGSANRVPTAALSASPTSGPAPLTVDFDGSGSSDPDAGDSLTYLWDFGDGQTATGASPTTSHTYTGAGTFTASLRVRDDHGATSTAAAVQIQSGNTAPVPVIETPSATARFRAADNVVLQGSATDAQDGTLAANRLNWRVLRHHGTSHTHPWLSDTTGNDIAISTPGPEDLATAGNSFLEVRLTATDSQGLSTTVTREFRPRLVDLSFATSPAGFDLEVNGEQVDSPFTFPSWEAWQFPVNAPPQRAPSGATWVFDSWSDGGAQTHTVTTGTTPATYTATFRPGAGPVATGGSVSTPEDAARSITLNATDPNGDAVTFAIERSPTIGSLGTLSGNSVTYTPAANANGPDGFDFSATDGQTTSPDTTVSITVTEVNDAPNAGDDTTSVAEDGSVLLAVRANDSKGPTNEGGQTLSVASVTTPAHGSAVVEGGSVRYTPHSNYSGPDSFGYQVCDNGTTAGSPAPLCDTATVGVTVTPVNDSPVAVDDAATVSPGGSILVDVLVNDSPGPPDEGGQALTVSSAGAAAHGSTAIEGNKVRYTPVPAYAGPDTFDYAVCDPGPLCDTGTVAVTVGNAAPAVTDMTAAATEDVQVAIELVATDPNGDALAFQIVSPPSHGTIASLVGRTARYQPAADYHGADSFTFRASDGTLSSGVATVSVTVHEINDPPLPSPDSARLGTDGGALTIDVTANDVTGPPDEAGQRLILTAVGTPAHGTAAISGSQVVYTPSRTHNGPDSFAYMVCDDGRSGGALDPRCATGAVDFAFSAFPLPSNLAPPRILGGARAGTRARAVVGAWDTPLLAADYAWLRCARSGGACARIPRATVSEYRTTLADVGRMLRVAVTGHNRFGTTTATSAGRVVATPVELAAVRHRGDDWVLLRNRTRSTVPLAGWSIRDGAGLVHRFRGGAIGPLKSLRVDTRDVWGAQDRATLRLPDGRVADVCAYRARTAVASC